MGNVSLRQYAPSVVVASVCILFVVTGTDFAFTRETGFVNAMLYHFSHANIFHLAANLVALFMFRPRWLTCVYGYLASSVAAVLPYAWVAGEATCGLSGFVFACWARRYWSFKIKPFYIFGICLISAFIPHVNWRIHLYSFILAFGIYAARDCIKKKRYTQHHS